MEVGLEWVFGIGFLFGGVLHLVPSTGRAMDDSYRQKYGDEAPKYRKLIGFMFVILGAGLLVSGR